MYLSGISKTLFNSTKFRDLGSRYFVTLHSMASLRTDHDFGARVSNGTICLLSQESVICDLISDVRRSYLFALSKFCNYSQDTVSARVIFDATPFNLSHCVACSFSIFLFPWVTRDSARIPCNFKGEKANSIKGSFSYFFALKNRHQSSRHILVQS